MTKNRTLRSLPLLAALALSLISSGVLSAQTRKERLERHVGYLASDELRGRKAGSPDAAKAAAYLVNEYEQMGVKPYFNDWYMPFRGGKYHNVVGWIEGGDPVLKNEYIVLGAHYDHLGVKDGQIYNGADDNASGSAVLVELARTLLENREELKRSVIIAAFDAEELGLYGSSALSDTLAETIGIESIKLMMSIDMVGWYKASGKLWMTGSSTIRNGKALLRSEEARFGINIKPKRWENSLFTATDTQDFAKKGIATLAVSTGLKSPYHKPEDDADLIDYQGMDDITGYLAAITGDIASDPSFEPSGKVAPIHSGPRALQIGITASAGNSSLTFPESAIDGKSIFSYDAGLTAKLALGRKQTLAVQVSGLYSHSGSRFPALGNGGAEIFSTRDRYVRNEVTIPAMLLIQTPKSMVQGYAGFGGYYGIPLKETVTGPFSDAVFTGNSMGLCATLGFRTGPLGIAIDWNWGLDNIFKDGLVLGGTSLKPSDVKNHIDGARFRLIWYL